MSKEQLNLANLSGLAESEIYSQAAAGLLRQVEALRLYEPLVYQQRFHSCKAKKIVLLKANRVGGTLCNMVELARALTNQDPYQKYPKVVMAGVIGYGQRHIGNVFHKYLFEEGAFQIIRDLETKKWRTYRPWKGELSGLIGDLEREAEARLAPPLIPERFLDRDSFAWLDRRQNVFNKVVLKNGSTLMAYNSEGDWKHAQGFKADLICVDEDLANQGWITEMAGRLIDKNGLLRWSGVWHGDNMAMDNIITLAEEEEVRESDPDRRASVVIHATIFDNPYLPVAARDAEIKQWKIEGEDVYRKRALGERTLEGQMMYSQFHADVNGLSPEELPEGEVPRDWCRYMVLDPGRNPASVLFAAVPPPQSKYGNIFLIYDEVQLKDADARKLADELARKMAGQEFEAFIIDEHGSRPRETGSGISIKRQYSLAFEAKRIVSNRTGSNFISGSDDVRGRTQLLRSMIMGWNYLEETSVPMLKFLQGRVPLFVAEMRRYKKKKDPQGNVIDEPYVRGIHLAICCEYLAAYLGLRRQIYHRPKSAITTRTDPKIMEFLEKYRNRRRNRSYINLN